MRKSLTFLFLVLLILSFFSMNALSKNVTVKIGGEELTYSGTLYNLELNGLWIPTKTPCIVLSNVAYVPLKEVFQDYLGLTVGYDSQTELPTSVPVQRKWNSASQNRKYIKMG